MIKLIVTLPQCAFQCAVRGIGRPDTNASSCLHTFNHTKYSDCAYNTRYSYGQYHHTYTIQTRTHVHTPPANETNAWARVTKSSHSDRNGRYRSMFRPIFYSYIVAKLIYSMFLVVLCSQQRRVRLQLYIQWLLCGCNAVFLFLCVLCIYTYVHLYMVRCAGY